MPYRLIKQEGAARRGEFTVSLSSADWGDAGSWDLMVALAEQRLSGC